MITIRGIAEEAGVSKSTVSRYFNNGYVSQTSAKKIEAIVKKYNFTPNEFARNLKAQKSRFTGIILPRMDSPSVMSMLAGLERNERIHGRQLLMVNTELDQKREIESMYNLYQNKIAGIILMATAITEEHVAVIQQIDVPVLIMGQQDSRLVSLTQNNVKAGHLLADNLAQFGHRQVVYVGVTEKDIEVGIKRKAGVMSGLQKQGVAIKTLETTFFVQDAYELGRKEFQQPQGTLYIAATDTIAIGLIKAAQSLGIKVGEELSIAGFGGYSMGDFVFPALTTVDLQHEQVGFLASNYMDQMIQGIAVPQETEIPMKMIFRESVGPVRSLI